MIRSFQPEDKKILFEIFRLNTPEYFDISEFIDFRKYIETNPNTYYVIEHNGEVVGAGGYHLKNEGKVARLSWDLVHPDHTGNRLGTQLVKHSLEHINAVPEIRVIEVWTSNKAYKFYEKMGFKIVNYQSDYWAKGLDLYQMDKALDKDSGHQ